MPKMVPTGPLMSVLDEPLSGSTHRTYLASLPPAMCLASSSSSETMAATNPLSVKASTTASLPKTSNFFWPSPVGFFSPTKPNVPTSAARRISRERTFAAKATCSSSIESSPTACGCLCCHPKMCRLSVIPFALIETSLPSHLLTIHRSIGAASGAEQSGLVVQDDAYGHRFQHRLQATFRGECFHERPVRQLLKNFGRNPAAHKHAPCRHNGQSQVARLRPIERNEQGKRLHAQSASTFKRCL